MLPQIDLLSQFESQLRVKATLSDDDMNRFTDFYFIACVEPRALFSSDMTEECFIRGMYASNADASCFGTVLLRHSSRIRLTPQQIDSVKEVCGIMLHVLHERENAKTRSMYQEVELRSQICEHLKSPMMRLTSNQILLEQRMDRVFSMTKPLPEFPTKRVAHCRARLTSLDTTPNSSRNSSMASINSQELADIDTCLENFHATVHELEDRKSVIVRF